VSQHQCTAALVKAKCISLVQCCIAEQAHSRFVSLQSHLWRFGLHTGVCIDPRLMHCSTGQGRMHFPLFSAALQNMLTAGLCHCNHTYGDLLSIQVCIDPRLMHCSTGQGRMHFPLFSAALQNRLTTGLCHCNHTYGDLLSIQVCALTQDSCTAALVKAECISHSSVLLCKTCSQQVCVTAITPMEICSPYSKLTKCY